MPYDELLPEQLDREISALLLSTRHPVVMLNIKPANDEEEFYDSLAYHRAMCVEAVATTYPISKRLMAQWGE